MADAKISITVNGANVAQEAFKGITQAVQGTGDKMTSFSSGLSHVNGMLGTFGVGLSVGALVGFGKALMDDADQLVKLHDKTAVSLQDLQRMQIAGDDAGVSIDSMANAVNKLQKNLGSGNDGASAALASLHLDLRDIKALTPEQQFYEISRALQAVKDPAQQVALATALFGKGAAEILPVIKRGFEDVRNAAVGMSDDTVRNLDAVGDAFSALWRTSKGFFANVLVNTVHPDLFGMRAGKIALDAARESAERMAPAIAKVAPLEVEVNVREIERALNDEQKRLEDVRKSTEKAAEQHAKFKEDLERNTEAAHKNEAGLVGLHETVGILNSTELDNVKASMAAFDAFKKLEEKIYDVERSAWIANFGFKGMTDGLDNLGTKSTELDEIRKSTDRYADGWKQIQEDIDAADRATADWEANSRKSLDDLVQHFVQLGQIAGGSLDDITRGLGTFVSTMQLLSKSTGGLKSEFKALKAIWDDLSTSGKTATAVMAGLSVASEAADPKGRAGTVLGTASKGAQIGSVAGPYGALVGAGVGAIVGALKVTQNEKDARAAFDAFQKQFGTLDQTITAVGKAYSDMGLSGVQAERDLAAALKATHGNAKDVAAALGKINGILDDQKRDAADLDAAIQKYGFSIDELGPTMRRQKLAEQSTEIMNEFRLLAGSGINVETVLGRMDEGINEFIATSLRTGTEVPSNMKPMLEKMIEYGTLVDENGDKITDLGESGITFSQTMAQVGDRIVAAFEKVLVKIGLIPDAMAKIPSSIPDPFANWQAPDMPRVGGADWGGAQAKGGDYLVKRPTLFLAGEAGPERATFTPAGAARAGGGPTYAPVTLEIDGRKVAQAMIPLIPRELRRVGAI